MGTSTDKSYQAAKADNPITSSTPNAHNWTTYFANRCQWWLLECHPSWRNTWRVSFLCLCQRTIQRITMWSTKRFWLSSMESKSFLHPPLYYYQHHLLVHTNPSTLQRCMLVRWIIKNSLEWRILCSKTYLPNLHQYHQDLPLHPNYQNNIIYTTHNYTTIINTHFFTTHIRSSYSSTINAGPYS